MPGIAGHFCFLKSFHEGRAMAIEMSATKWETLNRWVWVSSNALYDDLMNQMPVFEKLDAGQVEKPLVSRQLAVSCHLTSESTLMLLKGGRLWDSEILLRSVVEGTAKFCYLSTGTDADRAQRLKEYWHDLPEMDRLKRHERITEFLALVDTPNDPQWLPLRELLLDDSERDRIRALHPRPSRKLVPHRWSFSEIMKTLSRQTSSRNIFHGLTTLMHGYGMGSHQVHQDGDGVGMVWERNSRSQERKELIQLAHAGRQISDLCTMSFLRLTTTLQLDGRDQSPASKRFNALEPLFGEIQNAQEDWWAVEKHF